MSTTLAIPPGTDSGSVVIGSSDTQSTQFTESGTPKSASYIVDDNSSRIAQLMLRSSMQHGERMVTAQEAAPVVSAKKITKGKGKKNAPIVDTTPKYVQPLPAAQPYIEAVVLKETPSEKTQLEHSITFKNAFGQITIKVIDILESGDDNSLLVVMPADGGNAFTPSAGDIYDIKWGAAYDKVQKESRAFFPGFIYEWPSNGNKLMVLCKVVDTE